MAFFAFLHRIAAFALVAALTLEFVLLRDDLTVESARRIALADLTFGISAGAVFVVGFLRVFYFEKDVSSLPQCSARCEAFTLRDRRPSLDLSYHRVPVLEKAPATG